jgi:hypothetical protein
LPAKLLTNSQIQPPLGASKRHLPLNTWKQSIFENPSGRKAIAYRDTRSKTEAIAVRLIVNLDSY